MIDLVWLKTIPDLLDTNSTHTHGHGIFSPHRTTLLWPHEICTPCWASVWADGWAGGRPGGRTSGRRVGRAVIVRWNAWIGPESFGLSVGIGLILCGLVWFVTFWRWSMSFGWILVWFGVAWWLDGPVCYSWKQRHVPKPLDEAYIIKRYAKADTFVSKATPVIVRFAQDGIYQLESLNIGLYADHIYNICKDYISAYPTLHSV